jgi:hypothetical protein
LIVGLVIAVPATLQPFLGHSLEGVVRDAQGEPVAGAWIEVRPMSTGALNGTDFEGEPHRSMLSGADGSYDIGGMQGGTWIISVAASETPRTADESKALARPTPEHALPDGVAVARLVRRFASGFTFSASEVTNLCVPIHSDTKDHLHGRLIGEFEPGRMAYQLSLRPFRTSPVRDVKHSKAADGSPRTSFTAMGFSEPILGTVPFPDGHFDFGPMPVGDYDTFTVEGLLLQGDPADRAVSLFFGQVLNMKRDDGAFVIDVPRPQSWTARVVRPTEAKKVRMALALWGEPRGGGSSLVDDGDTWATLLTPGRYMAQFATQRVMYNGQLDPGFASAFVMLTVGDEPPPEMTLEAKPCPVRKLRVQDPAGKAVDNLPLAVGPVLPDGLADPCVITDRCHDGVIELAGLPDGDYVVRDLFKKDLHTVVTLTAETDKIVLPWLAN